MSELPKCLRCNGEMEQGFIVDNHEFTADVAQWVAGEPEPALLGGAKTAGRAQYYVITLRCKNCGYLESYAPSA